MKSDQVASPAPTTRFRFRYGSTLTRMRLPGQRWCRIIQELSPPNHDQREDLHVDLAESTAAHDHDDTVDVSADKTPLNRDLHPAERGRRCSA